MVQALRKIVLKKSLWWIAIVLLSACEGCEEPQPKTELEKLPPATQEGKNTFGCLVNGKAWVTKTSIDARAFYQQGTLSISAGINENDREQGIGFIIQDIDLIVEKYPLNDTLLRFAELGDDITNCIFKIDSNASGGDLIISHFDKTNRIISGKFYFKAFSVDCNDSVTVNEGRFDLMYAN
jgi:hypothetical protein